MDSGWAASGASAILPLSRMPRFFTGCCVVILSVSLATACSGRGSSGTPAATQSQHKPGSSGAGGTEGTYKRSADGFSLFTLPAGQGGAVGAPPTVVTRKVAWKFKIILVHGQSSSRDCTLCSNFRSFEFEGKDQLPLDATIKVTGAPSPVVEVSPFPPVYCPEFVCSVDIGFYPQRPGRWIINLNVDSPHFHARYKILADASY